MVRVLAVLVLLYGLWQVLLVLRMWLYLRLTRTHPLSGYTPRVAVIVPCWEAHPDLESKMLALLEQDYGSGRHCPDHQGGDHHVIFATGSTADPAWPVLDGLASKNPKATLVTSGTPTRRSQKVHNTLRALEEAGDAEVYVFADSDAAYPSHWLSCLVSSLNQPGVGATTGCFWWEASGGSLWTRALAWGFNTQIVPFFADDRLIFAWGGSMAIRASTFRKAGIADIWQNAAYDDLTLAAALSRRGLCIPFVPEALVTVPVPDGRLSWCFNWLKREMVAGKVYTPRMYWLGILLTLPTLLMAISPLLLLAAPLLPNLALPAFLLLSLLPIRMIAGVLFCLVMGKPGTARYAPLDYLGIVVGLAAIYFSMFSKRFTWAGVTYELPSSQETRVVGTRVE